ncbi:MAG: MoaD/ThiS family protein [Anaerolineae bacterium]|nr:MoaD/ThiS family protein [Anaerolineae bacterium]
MQLHVTFFGVLKQDAGTKHHTLDLPDDGAPTLRDLLQTLTTAFPALEGRLSAVAFAVDDALVTPDHPLHDGDRVALLPPVSGG